MSRSNHYGKAKGCVCGGNLGISTETHWEKAAKTRMGKYLTKMEREFISQSLLQLRVKTAMDIGAEAGRFSLLAGNGRLEMVSIDIDGYALRRLKLKNRGVSIIQADARMVPVRDSVFDVVFMVEVLDYIPELGAVMGECRRILKVNGAFFFSFGNRSSLKSRIKRLTGKSYRHSFCEVMRCLIEHKFSAKKLMGYNWLPMGRTSESYFVWLFAFAERILGLTRLPHSSPWVIVHACRSA
jgi:ubiquinone/menaquinone biosynthesis C-methylase UbiE